MGYVLWEMYFLKIFFNDMEESFLAKLDSNKESCVLRYTEIQISRKKKLSIEF